MEYNVEIRGGVDLGEVSREQMDTVGNVVAPRLTDNPMHFVLEADSTEEAARQALERTGPPPVSIRFG
jgi:hypothetical protein